MSINFLLSIEPFTFRTHFDDLASSNDAQGPENSSISLVEVMPLDKISIQEYVLNILTRSIVIV